MFVFIFVFVFVFVFAVDISDHLFSPRQSAALALEPDFALNYFGNTFALLLFVLHPVVLDCIAIGFDILGDN